MTANFLDLGQLPQRLLPYLDKVADRLLEFDPQTREELARLEGQAIAIEFKEIDKCIYLIPGAHGVHFRLCHEGQVRVRVRGTPFDYLALARSRVQGEPVPAGRIEIVGDLSAAQQVQAILGGLDVDWEEMLARALGDTAAHQVARAARGAFKWLGQLRSTMEANVSEYARYEAEVVPERAAVDRFNTEVDTLRNDAERLAERVGRLQRQLLSST